jgi:hypothetical protein
MLHKGVMTIGLQALELTLARVCRTACYPAASGISGQHFPAAMQIDARSGRLPHRRSIQYGTPAAGS